MNNLTESEYKSKLLLLLKQFDAYCRANNITYYLACGSLLGAVRHGGFIPWDDDIDVCIPRSDYNRLITKSQDWNQPFDFICYEKDNTYMHYFGKIVDKDTVIEYEHIQNKQNYGIFIDVFPLDYYTNKINIRKIQKKLFYSIKMSKLCTMKKYWHSDNYLTDWAKHLAYYYSKFKGNQFWQEKIRHYQLYCEGDLMPENCQTIHCATIMNREVFGPGKDIEFENIIVRAPKNSTEYLRIEYGDYMQLPPLEKRHSNHDYIVRYK